jgi:NAD(P)H dehydrogenase (quinone)
MGIGITGASGLLGRVTAELLVDAVDPTEVVLLTRRPAALDNLAARGASVRPADFDDPASLVAALAGIEHLLLVSTDDLAHRVAQHECAIDAARATGVRHVVYTSLINPVPGNPTGIVHEAHRLTEETLMASGLAWTILRNGNYARSSHKAAASTGQLVTNAGGGLLAPVSHEDCGRAAVAALTSPAHKSRTYTLTGPALLSQHDIAGAVGRVVGRSIEVVDVDDETFVRRLVQGGLYEPAARIVTGFGRATREGYFEIVTDDVQRLTGRSPDTLDDVFAARRDEVIGRVPVRTWGSTLRDVDGLTSGPPISR